MALKKILILAAVVAVLALLAGAVYAQTGDGFNFNWHVMAGGGSGGPLTGSGYSMRSTISQTTTGLSSDTAFEARQGYWFGVLSTLRNYLPVLFKP